MEKLIPCRFHVEVGSVLKAEGMRTTKQRLDIWDELCSTDDHRDIETILQSLIKKKINVSRATLYRTIDVFVKHDLLKKVSLGNGKILYEHNKKSISPRHDHILCEDCGEIQMDNRFESPIQKDKRPAYTLCQVKQAAC